MVQVGFAHHIGTFLLFVSSILLIVTTITAPVVSNISMLYVDLGTSSITYGTFGYCVQGVASGSIGGQRCSNTMVGYNAVGVLTSIDNVPFSVSQRNSINNLTRAMVLHPIAAGLAFVAFLASAVAGFIGAYIAGGIAFITWLLTLVIMAIDLSIFGLIRNHVNVNFRGNYAQYASGMWTCVSAMCTLLVGMIIVMCTCCDDDFMEKKKEGGA